MEGIDRTLKENYIAAEKAVENLLTSPLLDDSLRDKENTEKRLYELLKQVVSISDCISVSLTPLWKQVFSILQPRSSYFNFCILLKRLRRGQIIYKDPSTRYRLCRWIRCVRFTPVWDTGIALSRIIRPRPGILFERPRVGG
jgi:hypothetical protein